MEHRSLPVEHQPIDYERRKAPTTGLLYSSAQTIVGSLLVAAIPALVGTAFYMWNIVHSVVDENARLRDWRAEHIQEHRELQEDQQISATEEAIFRSQMEDCRMAIKDLQNETRDCESELTRVKAHLEHEHNSK